MKNNDFDKYELIKDDKNPFSSLYKLDDESYFYIEPAFFTQLEGFKERHEKENYDKIINAMIDTVKRNKKVVFTANFEFPQTEVDDSFIFLEITDITDPLHIFVEDKSRGSDYGD